MRYSLILKVLTAIICCYYEFAIAMLNDVDSKKPLKITAESAEFDRPNGTSKYIHNVKIDQGDTHVHGNQVVTKQNKTNALEEIIIYGDDNHLAYYEARPEPDKPKLIAIAKVIKFFPQKHYVILENQAQVIQGDNSIQGEHIEYDIEKQKMRALAKTSANGEKTRTTIVIHPDQPVK